MNWSREEALFSLALEQPVEQRIAFLDVVCGEDRALRLRLQALLDAQQGPTGFLPDHSVDAKPTVISATPLTEEAGTLIGRFKLLEKLGEGGFGAVWAAEQREPVKRRVALKIIKLGMDTKQVVARFEAERQALALMDHPNIAKVLDAGATDTGRPYFVMELVKGIPITKFCDENKTSTQDRLDLFIKVCQAIQHAHQKGIIHRDIKPSNILVTLHDGQPVPKVIDFGIAKATQAELTEKTIYTQHHQFIGTPAYMSPEQAEMSGLDIDTRSDIYSLGVLLYELLTGSTPFDTKELLQSGLDEMRRIIREREPIRPSTRLTQLQLSAPSKTEHRKSRIENDLDWIVMKCLEKDRTRRYDTANALAADLKSHLNHEPVVACPPTMAYQVNKFLRRHRGPAIATAVLLLTLIVGVVGTSLGLVRANHEREKALALAKREATANQQLREAERRADEKATELETTLYLNRVALAYREIIANRPAHALRLLKQCPEHLRNWEWNYLWRRGQLSPDESTKIDAKVMSARFSPRGGSLALATQQDISLWQISPAGHLTKRRTLSPAPDDPRDSMDWLAFNQDGTTLATVGRDFKIHLWHAISGVEQGAPLLGHTNWITTVAFRPGAEELATGSYDRTIRVWNLRDRSQRMVLTNNHWVAALAYSADGKRIAFTDFSAKVAVCDADTGTELRSLYGHLAPVTCAAFSPDGSYLATGSYDTTVRLWEVRTGRETHALAGHGAALAVAYSRDGSRLFSTTGQGLVHVWDPKAGKEILTLAGHDNVVNSVNVGSDGLRVITGAWDKTVRIFDASPVNQLEAREIACLRGHTNRVLSLAFSRDSETLFSAAEDGSLIAWNTADGLQRLKDDYHGAGAVVFDVAASASGTFLVTVGTTMSGTGYGFRVADAATLATVFSFEHSEREIFAADISPSDEFVITGGVERQLTAWDLKRRSQIGIVGDHASTITDVAFSRDGKHLVSISDNGEVKLWDATRLSERQVGRVLAQPTRQQEFPKIAIHPDGTRIAASNGRNSILVVDTQTGTVALPPLDGHGDTVTCVAFSPDGRFIASGAMDHTVRVWAAASGKLLATFIGHEDVLYAVAFSPDGRRLASSSHDQTVRLWRVPVPGGD